ncbi:MAG: MarR family transcriptional regulator [Rhodospirillales bacterium]|nr:MarR family transcriptional regulator [Rhodospirillales bacterium]
MCAGEPPSLPVGVSDPDVLAALAAYVKLLRASRAVLGRIEAVLAQEGLTPTQLGVLEAVLHKGPLTQRELGRKVLTSAGNMTDVVDKLEKRGLVHRSRVARDRRSVRVELTAEGEAMIRALFPRHAGQIAEAMAGLAAPEQRMLETLLRKLGLAAAALGG